MTSSDKLLQVETLAVPSFPVRLGQLSGVQISVQQVTESRFEFENTSPISGIAQCQASELLVIKDPAGNPLAVNQLAMNRIEALAAYDGSLDWGGPSGRSYLLAEKSRHSSVQPPDSMWTDAAGKQRICLDTQYLAIADATFGATQLSGQYSGLTTVTVSVTYTY